MGPDPDAPRPLPRAHSVASPPTHLPDAFEGQTANSSKCSEAGFQSTSPKFFRVVTVGDTRPRYSVELAVEFHFNAHFVNVQRNSYAAPLLGGQMT